MQRWERYLRTIVWGGWTVLIVSQVILAFFFHVEGIRALRYIGWIIWTVGAVFGWLPIFTLRRKGSVPKGKSYVKTTVLVDSGIYAVVRHPQYLAGILLSLALILVTQHWLIMIIGAAAIVLNYIDILIADQGLIEKFGDDYKRYMERVPRVNFLLGFIRLLRSRVRT
jgi:protein-S-isoprenylcysteine O-methyltransferase Ste14